PMWMVFFFQAEDGIRDWSVTGVQTCALPILQLQARPDRDVNPIDGEFHELPAGQRDDGKREQRRNASTRVELQRHAWLLFYSARSEERRVGKRGRSAWGREAE